MPIMFSEEVSLRGVKPALLMALIGLEQAFSLEGAILTVTSCTDGDHGEHSFHYNGLAVDIRSRNLNDEELRTIVGNLRAINVPRLQVVIEDRGGPNEHLHVEIDHPLDRPLHKSSSDRVTP